MRGFFFARYTCTPTHPQHATRCSYMFNAGKEEHMVPTCCTSIAVARSLFLARGHRPWQGQATCTHLTESSRSELLAYSLHTALYSGMQGCLWRGLHGCGCRGLALCTQARHDAGSQQISKGARKVWPLGGSPTTSMACRVGPVSSGGNMH